MKEDSFTSRCYKKLCAVPRGKVTTYKHLARALKSRAYRAVGQAMKNNPNAPKVPCHRVVLSNGKLGGYLGGTARKIKLLAQEGVTVQNGKVQDFKKHLHTF